VAVYCLNQTVGHLAIFVSSRQKSKTAHPHRCRRHRQMTPRPVQHTGGRIDPGAPIDSNRRQCFACRGPPFRGATPRHNALSVHQLLDHLLADQAILITCAFYCPWPVQHGGRVKRPRRSVLRMRADCGSRLFPAKLAVIVHYLPHQAIDHLLADQAILITAPALLDGARV
jgi:hypothetical protein